MKFLGIIFDEKLSFKSHLQYVCDKTRTCLFSLKSIAMTNYGVPASDFATIFNGAILPKLIYGLPVWSSALNSTGSLKKLSATFWFAVLMSARVAPSTSNKVLYPLANMLPPALFVEKEIVNRLLNIIQSSFFGVEEYIELITPSSEFMYSLHILLSQKYQITDSMLRDLFFNRLILGPEAIHLAEKKSLKVTLAKLDHLSDCSPGDLVAYTNGSKMEDGVGAAAILFQFPNLSDPINHIILTLPDSAMVYQAEIVGIDLYQLCVKKP